MDLSIMASGKVFMSYLHFLRKKWNLKMKSTRALHALVILSLLIPAISVPDASGVTGSDSISVAEQLITNKHEEMRDSSYQAPSFTHPEPRIGERENTGIGHEQFRAGQPSIPLYFIENVGQFDANALFRVRGAFSTVYITQHGLYY
jgi:hypothetical protein